jgi:hypothetical protein
MKKIILLAVAMIAAGSLLHAQNAGAGNGNAGTNKNSSSYTDANKNNVCDNFENNPRSKMRKGTGRFARGGGNGNNRQCVSQGCGRRNNGRGRS